MKGQHVSLRAVEPADLSLLYLWENSPENWIHTEMIGPFSYHVLKEFVEHANNVNEMGQLRLIVVHNESQKSMGCIDLYEVDATNQRAGVGILIANEEDRRKGFAKEGLELCKSYAKNYLQLNQLFCDIIQGNQTSCALFETCGFVQTGVKKQWKRLGKEYKDVLFYQTIL